MSNKLSYSKPLDKSHPLSSRLITDRFLDQLNLVEKIKKDAFDHEVDAVMILGDLFDRSSVDAVTLAHTVGAIRSIPQKVFILPGNHESSSVSGQRFSVEVFNSIGHDNLYCFTSTELKGIACCYSEGSWLRFWPVPYSTIDFALDKIKSYQKSIKFNSDGFCDVLLLHHNINGCSHLGWVCDDGLDSSEICEEFDFVLSGHFHNHQVFGPDDIGMYVGSPMHHDFGDAWSEKYSWIVEFNRGERPLVIPIENKITPKFYKISLNDKLEPLNGKELKYPDFEKGDFLRYEIFSSLEKWIELKPKIIAFCDKFEGINISYKHKMIRKYKSRLHSDFIEGKPIPIENQIRQYVEFVSEEKTAKKIKFTSLGLEILKEARENVY
jgi:DNA repair exonuclease SbcCD nuclease subunit